MSAPPDAREGEAEHTDGCRRYATGCDCRIDGMRSVRWHDNGRGPRILIMAAGEDWSVSAEYARKLRDDLTAALDEITLATGTPR